MLVTAVAESLKSSSTSRCQLHCFNCGGPHDIIRCNSRRKYQLQHRYKPLTFWLSLISSMDLAKKAALLSHSEHAIQEMRWHSNLCPCCGSIPHSKTNGKRLKDLTTSILKCPRATPEEKECGVLQWMVKLNRLYHTLLRMRLVGACRIHVRGSNGYSMVCSRPRLTNLLQLEVIQQLSRRFSSIKKFTGDKSTNTLVQDHRRDFRNAELICTSCGKQSIGLTRHTAACWFHDKYHGKFGTEHKRCKHGYIMESFCDWLWQSTLDTNLEKL